MAFTPGRMLCLLTTIMTFQCGGARRAKEVLERVVENDGGQDQTLLFEETSSPATTLEPSPQAVYAEGTGTTCLSGFEAINDEAECSDAASQMSNNKDNYFVSSFSAESGPAGCYVEYLDNVRDDVFYFNRHPNPNPQPHRHDAGYLTNVWCRQESLPPQAVYAEGTGATCLRGFEAIKDEAACSDAASQMSDNKVNYFVSSFSAESGPAGCYVEYLDNVRDDVFYFNRHPNPNPQPHRHEAGYLTNVWCRQASRHPAGSPYDYGSGGAYGSGSHGATALEPSPQAVYAEGTETTCLSGFEVIKDEAACSDAASQMSDNKVNYFVSSFSAESGPAGCYVEYLDNVRNDVFYFNRHPNPNPQPHRHEAGHFTHVWCHRQA